MPAARAPGSRDCSRALPCAAPSLDVRVPAADVDEADAVAVAHQLAHAFGLEFEASGVDGVAVRGAHLVGHRLRHLLAQLEAVGTAVCSRWPAYMSVRMRAWRSSNGGLPTFFSDRLGTGAAPWNDSGSASVKAIGGRAGGGADINVSDRRAMNPER